MGKPQSVEKTQRAERVKTQRAEKVQKVKKWSAYGRSHSQLLARLYVDKLLKSLDQSLTIGDTSGCLFRIRLLYQLCMRGVDAFPFYTADRLRVLTFVVLLQKQLESKSIQGKSKSVILPGMSSKHTVDSTSIPLSFHDILDGDVMSRLQTLIEADSVEKKIQGTVYVNLHGRTPRETRLDRMTSRPFDKAMDTRTWVILVLSWGHDLWVGKEYGLLYNWVRRYSAITNRTRANLLGPWCAFYSFCLYMMERAKLKLLEMEEQESTLGMGKEKKESQRKQREFLEKKKNVYREKKRQRAVVSNAGELAIGLLRSTQSRQAPTTAVSRVDCLEMFCAFVMREERGVRVEKLFLDTRRKRWPDSVFCAKRYLNVLCVEPSPEFEKSEGDFPKSRTRKRKRNKCDQSPQSAKTKNRKESKKKRKGNEKYSLGNPHSPDLISLPKVCLCVLRLDPCDSIAFDHAARAVQLRRRQLKLKKSDGLVLSLTEQRDFFVPFAGICAEHLGADPMSLKAWRALSWLFDIAELCDARRDPSDVVGGSLGSVKSDFERACGGALFYTSLIEPPFESANFEKYRKLLRVRF